MYGAHAVHLADQVRGEDLAGRSAGHDAAGVHHVEAVAEGGGLVEVVQHGQGGDAQLAYQVQDLQLVADVEVGGGLVQQEQAAPLGQGAGEQDALFLPAGQGGEDPFCGAGQADALQRPRAQLLVGRGVGLYGVRPMETISATVKSRSAGLSWASTAVRRAAWRAGSRCTSSPPTVTIPAVGRSAR